ncbi:MAG TPA: hypothetical protein VMV92_04105, partial [Streptosporangiaceae bacterium]|nr:hypothetical protein [Streptosporangiaceae bacterium]
MSSNWRKASERGNRQNRGSRIAKASARARAHVWKLIAERPGGFPWPEIAGKTLTGWLVTGMDATLVTASSDK